MTEWITAVAAAVATFVLLTSQTWFRNGLRGASTGLVKIGRRLWSCFSDHWW